MRQTRSRTKARTTSAGRSPPSWLFVAAVVAVAAASVASWGEADDEEEEEEDEEEGEFGELGELGDDDGDDGAADGDGTPRRAGGGGGVAGATPPLELVSASVLAGHTSGELVAGSIGFYRYEQPSGVFGLRPPPLCEASALGVALR